MTRASVSYRKTLQRPYMHVIGGTKGEERERYKRDEKIMAKIFKLGENY